MSALRNVLPQSPEERATIPEVSVYRDFTIALLRRYLRMSMELGRLPSLVGREFFRAKVSSYRMQSFEDVVILVHDVDRCLSRLDRFSQAVIARVVLEEHSHDDAARLLGCARETVTRKTADGLDQLSQIFLDCGLLRASAWRFGPRRKEAISGESMAGN